MDGKIEIQVETALPITQHDIAMYPENVMQRVEWLRLRI